MQATERDVGKKITEFSQEEILNMYRKFNLTSVNTLQNYNNYLRAYCDFIIYKTNKGTNRFADINKEMLKTCIDEDMRKNKYITYEHLKDIEEDLLNYTDAAILECLWNGIAEKELTDLTYLERSQLDENNMEINLKSGRTIKMYPRLYKLLDGAFKETDLVRYGETTRVKKVNGYGKLYKVRDNAYKDSDSVRFRWVYRKIMIVRDYVGLPNMSMKTLQGSGMLHYIKQGMERTGLGLREFLSTKSGEKKRLCTLAIENAKEILRLEKSDNDEIAQALKALFNLQNTPYRFEVFDTSHHKGAQCVGAMIVYDGRDFAKESYRHYLLEGKDEYTQMREMLTRRIEDFAVESPPDLWVLDGGAGQINLAKDLLQSVGVNLEVIGIAKEKLDSKAHRAKGSARDILRDESLQEYRLPPSDKRLQFLQKLRDEAHRFAITFHQKQKQKTMQHSKILEIKGIGKATQNKLLAYFGSFENIKNAELDTLEKVLPKNLAQSVFKASSED